jgi:site-specific DNA-methyltransferase (adenine-specific)
MDMNTLYFGDNLQILREHIPSESVALIYLDPPFNSNRAYNVYLSTPKGQQSDAQITAFDDTWHWGDQAEREYSDLLRQPNTDIAALVTALRSVLHETDLMAYLVMMTSRLLELYRVLKPTGSLYLHCDPTASHYLKIVLDSVFGVENFRNEIVWKRSFGHGDSKKSLGRSHDVIFYYSKTENFVLNRFYHDHNPEYLKNFFKHEDERGIYKLENLTSPNPRPNLIYPYKGYPAPEKGWRVNLERMQALDADNRLHFPAKKDGRIMKKVYLHELEGQPMTDLWSDINPLSAHDAERLGYPTQKPQALLERIISASSNPGDLVLDPFCGCGTAVHAAHKLGRKWLGIDITHLAVHLIERRMEEAFPGLVIEIHGEPKDLDSARDLALRDKYEFQYWACALVNAQPYKGGKKGADSGIDGIIYFQDEAKTSKKIIVSVKGGETVNRAMMADLKNSVEREHAQIGLFVTLAEPTDPMRKEAAAAGYYTNPYEEQFPKIQILTIADLLDGRKPNYRDFTMGSGSHKKAKTEKQTTEQPGLFG